jgi:hypothetical protein
MDPPLTVLIDARNVLRSQWPNIPEDELVELARGWAADRGHRPVIVFDGRGPEAEAADVVGTGRESADDWLTREAARLAEAGEPFWLVTSDRGLRGRAGGRAERVIGGGSFARELTRR